MVERLRQMHAVMHAVERHEAWAVHCAMDGRKSRCFETIVGAMHNHIQCMQFAITCLSYGSYIQCTCLPQSSHMHANARMKPCTIQLPCTGAAGHGVALAPHQQHHCMLSGTDTKHMLCWKLPLLGSNCLRCQDSVRITGVTQVLNTIARALTYSSQNWRAGPITTVDHPTPGTCTLVKCP